MEELDFQALLDKFANDGFQRGEQVILSNFGTNQTMLSIIFGMPNTIKVIDQSKKGRWLVRQVELYCGEDLVCYANTKIPWDGNREDVIADIMAGELGLGQIVVKHNLPSQRTLVQVARDDRGFWRTYIIKGPELYLEIEEYFPREPFEAVGWLHKSGSSMRVTDDEGEDYDFTKFIALGVHPNGEIFVGVEDENLTLQEASQLVVSGVQTLGEICSGITAGFIKDKED